MLFLGWFLQRLTTRLWTITSLRECYVMGFQWSQSPGGWWFMKTANCTQNREWDNTSHGNPFLNLCIKELISGKRLESPVLCAGNIHWINNIHSPKRSWIMEDTCSIKMFYKMNLQYTLKNKDSSYNQERTLP